MATAWGVEKSSENFSWGRVDSGEARGSMEKMPPPLLFTTTTVTGGWLGLLRGVSGGFEGVYGGFMEGG